MSDRLRPSAFLLPCLALDRGGSDDLDISSLGDSQIAGHKGIERRVRAGATVSAPVNETN